MNCNRIITKIYFHFLKVYSLLKLYSRWTADYILTTAISTPAKLFINCLVMKVHFKNQIFRKIPPTQRWMLVCIKSLLKKKKKKKSVWDNIVKTVFHQKQIWLLFILPCTLSMNLIMFKKQTLNKAKKTELVIFQCFSYKKNEVGMANIAHGGHHLPQLYENSFSFYNLCMS